MAAAIAAAVGATVPSADGRLPLHSSLRFADSHAAGCDTLNILNRKLKANRCAKTTHGIHIMGIAPPYAGSMTASVALLLILASCCCCWSTEVSKLVPAPALWLAASCALKIKVNDDLVALTEGAQTNCFERLTV